MKSIYPDHNYPLKVPHMVQWLRPNTEFVALNVDGNSLGNPGKAGYGGLLRDNMGSWISGFMGSVGISNNLHVEPMGPLYGLQLAWDMGFRKVICYSDSMDVISLVHGSRPNYHHYMATVLRIQDLIYMDWEISINHILRKGNSCADYLAKKGVTSTSTFTILDYVPYELKYMLFSDAIGTWFARS
ncbi:putative ribonuclease H-like domain-containing protein [Lupinus albus]|uniref:Putative ribonuclease H-like domain-containing protein n=1 Tax=Lupinus albus TaxID=3870 RepID=A0A6A4Q7C0_LUPAL|nr:putative ribonuclease H-like domain-containing protein [Lupinus albus]